jgi:hypothetical protein
MSFISDLFTNQPAQQAAADTTKYALQGQTQGLDALTAAKNAAQGYYGGAINTLEQAKNYYSPMLPGAQGAWQQYAQLVGAAPESTPGSVQATLESQPGFQTAMDLGLQAANRTSAAGGMGASGNAIMSAMDVSRGLESQNINQYAQRLLAMAGYDPSIAQSLSGISGAQAGVQGQQAAAETAYGGNVAGLDVNTANAIGTAQANADLAKAQAASNVWSAIMGVAGLGVNAASAFMPKKLTIAGIPAAGTTTTTGG